MEVSRVIIGDAYPGFTGAAWFGLIFSYPKFSWLTSYNTNPVVSLSAFNWQMLPLVLLF